MKNVFTWSDLMDTSREILGLGEDLVIKYDALKYFAGWKKDLEDVSIPESGIHFYVWNISSNKEGFYNEQFIKDAIDTIWSKIPDDTDIHIHMGWKVGKLLNPKDPFPTMEKQFSLMQSWIKKLPWSIQKRVCIHDITEKHTSLFNYIEDSDSGVEWLSDNIDEDAWSLYIASLLYKAMESDQKFSDKIQGTKPGKVKESGWGDHYATLELAIRMQDMLDGNTLQWWEFRQKRYDAIILDILRWYKTWGRTKRSIPELEKIREMFEKENISFSQLYFDKNAYEKVKGDKRYINTIRVMWLTILASLGLLWYVIHSSHVSEQKAIKEAVAEALEYNFKDKDPRKFWNEPWYTYERNRSVSAEVRNISEEIVSQFIDWYGIWDTDIEALLNMIFDELKDAKVPQLRILQEHSYEEFIDNKFIPKNSFKLTGHWIDIEKTRDRDKFLDIYMSTYSWDIPHNKQSRENRAAYDYLSNYIVKWFVSEMHTILSRIYSSHRINTNITSKIFLLQHEGKMNMEDLKKMDLFEKITFIEEHLLDSSKDSVNFKALVKGSVNLDIETLPEIQPAASYIWAINIEDKNRYLYSVYINRQRYIIVSDTDKWDIYQVHHIANIRKSNDMLKQILELL